VGVRLEVVLPLLLSAPYFTDYSNQSSTQGFENQGEVISHFGAESKTPKPTSALSTHLFIISEAIVEKLEWTLLSSILKFKARILFF